MKYFQIKNRPLLISFCLLSLIIANPCMSAVSNDTVTTNTKKKAILRPFKMQWQDSENSKLNLSFLLEKPAGKDGFITIKDGHFVKPSGERFKIWGVNLVFGACFPEKSDAPKVAAYLARLGINAVRLHHIDGEWGQTTLMKNGLNHTREFSPELLDKLDFFIANLIKAGIYININLNNSRKYREGDDVPDYELLGVAKGVTFFDDRLIELQKEYAKQLLTHVNPYTGNSYTDEPAVSMVEVVNENSLVEAWINGRLKGKRTTPEDNVWSDIPEYYGNTLTIKYNEWLKINYTSSDIRLLEEETGVNKGENIPRLLPEEFKKSSDFRFAAEARFLIETEQSFFSGMYKYLKDELGVKSVITGNSDHNHYLNNYAYLSNAALLDYVDSHVYWNYYGTMINNETGKERWGRKNNVPMVSMPERSTVVNLSRSAVEGKPFTVSETNHGNDNDFYSEGIPIMGAYAGLQDWDGVFYFALAHREPAIWDTFRPGTNDMVVDPVQMANFTATGLLFMRSDIKSPEQAVLRGYSKDDIIKGAKSQDGDPAFYTENFSPLTPLMHKTRITSFHRTINDFPAVKDKKIIKSETGELIWHADDDKSFVEVSSPNSEAFVGFIPETAFDMKHIKVNIKNEFGAIILTSLDAKPIETSEKMLLVTTARSGFTDMVWNEDKTELLNRGKQPTIIEVIEGEITLQGLKNGKKIIIEPLDGSGNPIKSSDKTIKNGTVTLNIGNDVTVWYYLTVKR